MPRLKDLKAGEAFRFPDEPSMRYIVTEQHVERAHAVALDTGMQIRPSYVFHGAEEVIPCAS